MKCMNEDIVFADLHLHSSYARACSEKMNLEVLSQQAKIKGLNILGTGDFTHPKWLEELKQKLKFNNGIYEFNEMNFVLQAEISLIYKQDFKQRRIHHLILAENFEVVDQINEFLDKKGRRDYDGRPIFGFSSVELAEEMMKISKAIMIIPAHAWTPWYGIFGSMSGFDSLKECFQEKTKYIYSIETGLSSDPQMNWRLSFLDGITLISNSDAHSPWPHRLGREANAFSMKEINYQNIVESIRTRKDFLFTIEVDPGYGKYHFDGHRNCNFSCDPKESARIKSLCPKCGKILTIGVLNRVQELADRKEGYNPDNVPDYKSILPLHEIIAYFYNGNLFSTKVKDIYELLIEKFGNEFNILLNVEKEELKKIVDAKVAEMIIKNREGKTKIIPGYDGVYGKLIEDKEQKSMKEFVG